MADTPQDLMQVVIARQALLLQLMRLLLRERAAANSQTEDDITEWAEGIKQFFEGGTPEGVARDYLVGAVDGFFNLLAAEVKADRDK